MKLMNLDHVAARLRLEIVQGARKEAIADVISGLHPSEVGRVLEELTPEQALSVFQVLDRKLAAIVMAEVSPDLLEYFLRNTPMSVLVKILAMLKSDEGFEEDYKVAPHLAEVLPTLDEPVQAPLFLALPRPVAAEVFALLEPSVQDALLLTLTDQETRQVLADLSPDDRTDLFEDLPGQATQRLLNLMSAKDLAEARRLLGYPEESVGRLMTPDYVAVRPDWTVARALEHIRTKGRDSETSDVIYITDSRWKLVDALDLKRFVMADPESTVESLMDEAFVSLSAFEDREQAVEMMQRYDLSVLPVVDADGVLVGIVTFDDVMDVAEEEVTEDFHRVAAVSPLRKGFRETAFFDLYRKRIGWLLILVFVNIITGITLHHHEATIAATIALVFFLPLLIASGGNAGSQAATLMIRALATGDIKAKDWLSMVIRDAGVSGSMGLAMGFAVWVLGFYRGGFEVGVVVALSMICIVMAGSIIGTLLPFILTRLNMDPATASAPLVTSVADIVGVFIYMMIARSVLGI